MWLWDVRYSNLTDCRSHAAAQCSIVLVAGEMCASLGVASGQHVRLCLLVERGWLDVRLRLAVISSDAVGPATNTKLGCVACCLWQLLRTSALRCQLEICMTTLSDLHRMNV